MRLHLMGHPEDLSVVRLDPGTTPEWDFRQGPFSTITWTDTETSVMTLASAVPAGLTVEGPFRVVEVAGPLEFGMYGVMARILAPLVDARISVLAMSTHDTDWILVRTEELDAAVGAWRRGGLVYTATTLTGSAS